jgi:nitroreductase
MDTFEAIARRRAVKHFDPTFDLSPEEERRLLEATMLSPTAFNIQHWRFVIVRDPALRREIRKVAWDQTQVTDASLLVVLCADVHAWEKDPARYWSGAPEAVRDFLVPAIRTYYEGRPQVQRDECMRSCGLAGQTLMLAANAMGYDACPMDGFDFDAVARLIDLPEDHLIAFMVAIGKGTQEPWPRQGQIGWDEAVVENGFG